MADRHYRLCEPRISMECFDGEAILIDFESGNYYSLSTTAAQILQLVRAGCGTESVIDQLSAAWPTPRDVLAADVAQFIEAALAEQLLSPAEAATTEATPEPLTGGAKYEPPVIEKYEDMQDLLLLDPIHEVAEDGWPVQRKAG